MADSETSSDKAAKAPIDAEGFLKLLDTVQKFTGSVERALRRVAPKATLADFLALRSVAAADGAPAEAVKPPVLKALVRQGYVVQSPDSGTHELSGKGREVLDGLSATMAELVATLGEGDRPLNAAAGRPLMRAAAKLRKQNHGRGADAAQPADEEALPA